MSWFNWFKTENEQTNHALIMNLHERSLLTGQQLDNLHEQIKIQDRQIERLEKQVAKLEKRP